MPSGAGVLRNLQKADLSACDKAGSFLQSGFWGRFKARFGWEALAFTAFWEYVKQLPGENSSSSAEEKPLLVLRRPLAAGLSLAYVPWGPELPRAFPASDETRRSALKELAVYLREALPGDTVFIRFDPPWYSEGATGNGIDLQPLFITPPFIRAGADIQPPDTVLVDLTKPMESIMEEMKPKWRYNIRLALKKGVIVRRAGAEGIPVFYDLLKKTARRDGIAIHGIDYYESLFMEYRPASGSPVPIPVVSLYLAEHEGDVLAGIVTLFRGNDAVYLYGASSDVKRNLMAPYALQAKAMEDAKASGCTEYDLFGIPPGEDPSHPMAGLYRFKTGFGGRIVSRPGSWDYQYRPLLYRLFRLAEILRKKFRTLKKKMRR